MKYNPEIHHRRSIRLKDYDYSQAGVYFVTICTRNRECLFGDIIDKNVKLSAIGNITFQYWVEIPRHFENVQLDEFIIMPNHMHGIISIIDVGAIHELPLHNESSFEYRKQRRKMLLPKIIGRFKMNSAKYINQIRNVPGIPIWHRNYYEHVIRNEDELNRIREYIINNPLQWAEDENNPVNIKMRSLCRGEALPRPSK